jgi:hypothetical protein
MSYRSSDPYQMHTTTSTSAHAPPARLRALYGRGAQERRSILVSLSMGRQLNDKSIQTIAVKLAIALEFRNGRQWQANV